MQYQINSIKSISDKQIAVLEQEGINTAEALLRAARTPADRRELARTTGIEEMKLFKWVNYADLSRIDGLEPDLTALLEQAGITTMLDLRGRSPFSLHSKLVSLNKQQQVVSFVPDMLQVADMVNHAKTLEPEVAYQ